MLDFKEDSSEIRRLSTEIFEGFKEKFPVVKGQCFWMNFTRICQDFEIKTMLTPEQIKDQLCFEEELDAL